MSVVDLAEVRDAKVRMRQVVGELERVLENLRRLQAERAFIVSWPLMATDPALAGGVKQWVQRRLRQTVRRMLSDVYKRETVDDVLEQVSFLFSNNLTAFEHEADHDQRQSSKSGLL